jgi:glycogen debranching enzyme
VWCVAVQDYVEQTGDKSVLRRFYPALVKQIGWFEKNRKAQGEGFYYTDITLRKWESGVDEGIRFDGAPKGNFACIDATCHVYWMYKHANAWAKELGQDNARWAMREKELGDFIRQNLYCAEDGMFYDSWAIKDRKYRHLSFESMWPVVTGAASSEQAGRYITGFLLNTNAFFTPHPIATVGRSDPKFEPRMWRGPAWNSMTYWAARGCLNYQRGEAAKVILERALDDSAVQFARTGKLWEFYDSLGGDPEKLKRKKTGKNQPCSDYLGHNPLLAMARMYDKLTHAK